MRILINDLVPGSDAPAELQTPALSDISTTTSFSVSVPFDAAIDCIGVGYTDATEVTIDGQTVTLDTTNKNGLYLLDSTLVTNGWLLQEDGFAILQEDESYILVEGVVINVSHNGTYMGRFGMGKSRFLGAAPTREPGFYTTAAPRVTASGQTISGAGGYSGRRIDVDFRYKIDRDIFDDFETAYASQISRGYPFFLYFDKETARMPWERLYAATDNELLFQSSVNRFLYSRKFSFTERF